MHATRFTEPLVPPEYVASRADSLVVRVQLMDIRYKPTTAPLDLASEASSIDDLNVSEKWKERFRIIEKAGPFERGKYQNQDALTPAERRKINFNVLAFLFSGLYYFCKGMPRKALVFFGGGWIFAAAMTIIESIFNFTAPNSIFWIAPGAVAASFANRDYYQKMLFGERMWPSLSILESWIAAITFALLSFGLLIAAVWWTVPVQTLGGPIAIR
jgi:hypothetical protein